jgi:general secretion pathway protein A
MFLEFYGLNEQPFGVTPDPRFLYMGPAQQEAFSSLVYGIETGRGFMALIASPGLGKTTILLRLMEYLRESARTAYLFQMHSNSKEFIRNLIADLDIEPMGHDVETLQRQLGDVLIQEAKSGRRIVVAIDEAQNLDFEVLETVRMLSNFETPRAKLMQIVLAGQPQLADKLASPRLEQLRQRVSIITHSTTLKGIDISRYIDHRLRVAGYMGSPLFTPLALGLIGAYSQGIPRNINNICFQALSLGYAKNQKKIDDVTLREVIADLNLESLGTMTPRAPAKTSPSTRCDPWAADSRFEPHVEREAPSQPVILGAAPAVRTAKSRLDAVNLSPALKVGDNNAVGNHRGNVTRRPPTILGHKRTTGSPAWVGLAGVLLGLCIWPWLKPGLDASKHHGSPAVSSPKYGEVSTTPASQPPITRPPDNRPEPQGEPSNQNKEPASEKSSLGDSAPDTSLTPPDVPDDANSAAPATEPAIVQRPKRPTQRPGGTGSIHAAGFVPESGRLVVESNVSGAQISIDGENDPKWITPRIFSLAPGTHLVSVSRPGYDPWARRVRVDEGREEYVLAEIVNHDGGIFTVDTEPPGMQVFIDGQAYGPSRVEAVLRSGWHVCEVIPGPGLRTLVSKFHLNPGEALTRRIRMSTPVHSSKNDVRYKEKDTSPLAAGLQGGNP